MTEVIELVHIVDNKPLPPEMGSAPYNLKNCMARKKDGNQCTHIKKIGDYCGVHLKKLNVLRVDEACLKKNKKNNVNRIRDEKNGGNTIQSGGAAITIQSAFRGWLVRKSNVLRGPGYKNVALCNNTEDIYLLESLTEIHPDDFFTMKDIDGFIYGFHIESVHKYVFGCRVNGGGAITNPYNKSIITNDIVENIDNLYRLCCIRGVRNKIQNVLPTDQKFVFRNKVITVFQKMDDLNNYTDINWFMNLTNLELIRLVYLIKDLFDYRMELSSVKKSRIVRMGTVFYKDSHHYKHVSFSHLRNEIIDELNRLVSEGETRDDRYLGSLIILSGLVELDENCAMAYPWLVQGTFN